ncbi:carboxypeptidase regulatory-like domain-containing protein [Microbacterium sp.]|uniref:carboxypeptidase regulatory-like domain-containing protein n=1 Tax=Microbacterium sp. TaxID=51671 RepID=UPI0035B35CF6
MLTGGLLSAVPAQAVAASEGSLSGTVTDESGNPVQDVQVTAHVLDVPGHEGSAWAASTAADGTYVIDALPEGAYQVEFTTASSSPSVVGEWWDDAADQVDAAVITVAAGETTSGISPQLAAGAEISGTVVDEAGAPVADVQVRTYRYIPADDFWAGQSDTFTGADGTYSLRGLRAGDYKVEFTTESATAEVAGEWWDDALTESSATVIPLSSGDAVSGIDPALSAAGSISGVVTDGAGTPLPGVSVVAHSFDEEWDYWVGRAYATTDENGQYTMPKVRPGTYRVEFSGSGSGASVLSEWWQDAVAPAEATDVVVAAGETTSGISPELARAGSVTGVVTDENGAPVQGVVVTAWAEDVPGFEGRGWGYETSEDGTYLIDLLPAGSYRIEFTTDRAAASVVGEWWESAADEESATVIAVHAGATTEGISAELAPGGTISGTVTDASGGPVSGLMVYVSSAGTVGGFQTWGATDSDGRYVARGLPAGQYLVRFEGSDDVVGEWWDDARTKGEATFVTVAAGTEVPEISPQLAAAGGIEGVVTDEAGAPVAGVHVRVTPIGSDPFDIGQRIAVTAEDGSYLVRGLAAGDHTVFFATAEASSSVLSEWWDDAQGKPSSTPVAVQEGATTPGISPQLAAGGQISGTVVAGDAAAFPNYEVHAYFENEQVSAYSYVQAEDGAYTIRGLRSGTYTLRFTGFDASGKALVEWWDGAPDRASATEVPVTVGTPVTGIDVLLSEGDGSIVDTRSAAMSGTVTDALGDPVADAEILIMHPSGQAGTGTSTDAAGNWFYGGLNADDYKVAFRATLDGDVVTEYWNDASDFDSAEVVTLGPGEQRTGISATLGGAPAPALESAVPTISGSARFGAILTAVPGAWTEGATFAYQWLADGNPILGATAATLVLGAAQVGRSISVVVTGSKAGYESASMISLHTAAVQPAVLTTAVPSISGKLLVGSTVTAKPGAWTPGTAHAFQWFASGAAIPGATNATFTITPAQLAKKLTVRVTGSLANYSPAVVTSAASATIGAGVLATSTPTISGTLAYGYTLTAAPGTWTSGTSFTYQWYASGVAISGASGTTLKLGTSQKGKAITVKVIGKKTGYSTVTKISAATARVATTATPTISGIRAVGATLTAKTGAWTTGTAFSYQWYADGAPITGATSSTYVLASAREHDRITLKVIGRKSGFGTVARFSVATAQVMRAGTPSISGSARVTGTLTAATGTWTTSAILTYQWYANGSAISGATSKSLKLTTAHAGKTITVKVTGRLTGYSTVAKTSRATAAIGYPSRTAPSSTWSCPSWAPIKGNADSMIYHMPWQRYYDATQPEDCFRTETAAVAAGYRRAKV